MSLIKTVLSFFIFAVACPSAYSATISSANCQISDLKVSPDNSIYTEIAAFYNAGGCMIKVDTISNPLVPGPFFIITQMNTVDIVGPPAISLMSPSQKNSRHYFEEIASRKNMVIIYAPIMVAGGVVIDRKIYPEFFQALSAKMPKDFSFDAIDRVFTFGYYAFESSVIAHEFQHVLELENGRLYRVVDSHAQLQRQLSRAIGANLSGTQGEDIVAFLQESKRYANELTAIKAQYLHIQSITPSAISFIEYFKGPQSDYSVNFPSFYQKLKDYVGNKNPYLKMVGTETCKTMRADFQGSNIAEDFNQLFPVCVF